MEKRRRGRRSTIGDVMGMTPNKLSESAGIGEAAAEQAALVAARPASRRTGTDCTKGEGREETEGAGIMVHAQAPRVFLGKNAPEPIGGRPVYSVIE